jgi:hypothetical protein
MESISSTRSRFRRREFVQEEVRKTMLNYLTNIKGEITDIVVDELIDYYNRQTLKLYYLENELIHIKNSSLSVINNIVRRISKQQYSFESNISLMEYRIKNLTKILNELKQEKSIQYVRKLVSIKKDILPIGK